MCAQALRTPQMQMTDANRSIGLDSACTCCVGCKNSYKELVSNQKATFLSSANPDRLLLHRKTSPDLHRVAFVVFLVLMNNDSGGNDNGVVVFRKATGLSTLFMGVYVHADDNDKDQWIGGQNNNNVCQQTCGCNHTSELSSMVPCGPYQQECNACYPLLIDDNPNPTTTTRSSKTKVSTTTQTTLYITFLTRVNGV